MTKVAKSRKPVSPFADSVPTIEFEREAGFPFSIVIGVDEVGRGCLAGPVVAAACVLPTEWNLAREELIRLHAEIEAITDSKALSEKEREALAPWIRAKVRAYGIGSASVEEIDRINIYHASHLAMERAVAECWKALGSLGSSSGSSPVSHPTGSPVSHPHVLVDGNAIPKAFRGNATAIVKGDLRSLSIACASIIAKVHRDGWMRELAMAHPGFGFEVHKGYATPKHREALRSLGPTEVHRRSFAPVLEVAQPELFEAESIE